MRRDAKASSAGSTRHSAEGRGRLGALSVSLASLLLVLLAVLGPATASAAHLGSFGPDGTSATDFKGAGPIAVDQVTGAVYVGDVEKQVLYKFDAQGSPLNWGGSAPYITGHEINGLSFGPSYRAEVAVDSDTHVVYVTSGDQVRAFEANGEPHIFTGGLGTGTSEIPGATELTGVTVDVNGRIYAGDFGTNKVRIYASSGALLTEFIPETNSGFKLTLLSVAPDGALYVTTTTNPTFKFVPSQFPVTASTTYGLGQSLRNASAEKAIASIGSGVDPVTGYVYVTQFQPNIEVAVFNDEAGTVGSLGAPGQDGDFLGVHIPENVAVNGGIGRVYVATDANSGEYSKVEMFDALAIPVLPPTVTATSVIDLDTHTATLRAGINPNTLPSAYHFEYGLSDCSTSSCTSVPLSDVAIGDGHKNVAVSQEIAGLEPGTTYHYRVVAENSEGTTEGPDKTFATPRTGLGFGLADSRAWEMVTPPNKFGGKLLQFAQGVMQAAADGNGIAYESVTSIEANPDGNRAIDTSTVLSHRGSAGWRSKDITPPHTEVGQLRFGGDYKTFSLNLERALLEQPDDTLLSPEASEETPYLRENTEPGTFRPLVTSKEGFANVPLGTVFGGGGGSGTSPVIVKAADPALTHPVISSRTPLVAGAAPGSLYQWDEGQLQPVSELPANEGGAVVSAQAGAGIGSIRNAVSEDGSRVFWGAGNYDFNAGSNMAGLYVRDTVSQETGRLDVKQPGASGEGPSVLTFRGASRDGAVVFFTDARQLTADASSPGPDGPPDSSRPRDLYRCEVGPVEGGTLGCTSLVDLSAPIAGSGEKAEVLGTVPGFSEDGTRVYFFAKAVLDTSPSEAGDIAIAGQPNLYLWEEGEGRRFIATLSPRDKTDWGVTVGVQAGGNDPKVSAAVSSDGRYLAFMSERSLTGYDNRDAKSEEPLEEVFRYDALEDRLDCISCNPSGASPVGKILDSDKNESRADSQEIWRDRWVGAILPVAQETEPNIGLAFHHPRVVLDNGRVFFNAVDSLVSADANGEWDVYQYEPTGVGDCTSSSEGAAIARSAGGCVSLLSSGTAEEEASFIDASESGDSVFFITPARLSVLDEDFELDVYVSRVNGVTATLPVINECLGEACQPAPNPPNDPTPASAAFRGAGNVPSERCPQSKRKVIRAGSARCVAKKHKKKPSHKAKRAAEKRRTGR